MSAPFFKVKKLREDATLPSKRREDAGFDFYVFFPQDPFFLFPSEIEMLHTGLAMHIPEDYILFVTERSSTGVKGMATRGGIIDSGYRGEIKVPINNTSHKLIIFTEKREDHLREEYSDLFEEFEDDILIYPQSKAVAQGVLVHSPHVDVEEVDEIDTSTVRGTQGYGSTGK